MNSWQILMKLLLNFPKEANIINQGKAENVIKKKVKDPKIFNNKVNKIRVTNKEKNQFILI